MNTKTKQVGHTPGPWKVDIDTRTPNHEYSIRDTERGQQIAVINEYRVDQRDADAALIAAAPDLLEACKLLLKHSERLVDARWCDPAREAIAKAEGRV